MSGVQYKDEDGNVGVGQTITDLERNNRLLEKQNKVLWYFAFLLTLFFGLVVWVVYHVIKNDVVNNIVAKCVC